MYSWIVFFSSTFSFSVVYSLFFKFFNYCFFLSLLSYAAYLLRYFLANRFYSSSLRFLKLEFVVLVVFFPVFFFSLVYSFFILTFFFLFTFFCIFCSFFLNFILFTISFCLFLFCFNMAFLLIFISWEGFVLCS